MKLTPIASILISAALFGLSAPLAKLLLRDLPPVALAGILYLGSFLGLTLYRAGRGVIGQARSAAPPLARRDLPWLAGAILAGGIAAPILLMLGLSRVSGITASLLLNLEAAATALFAVILFREAAGRSVWIALALMSGAGILVSWDPARGSAAWTGGVLILAAMAGWGLDNNLTRKISDKDAVRIAQAKGLAAGIVSLSLAVILGYEFRWGLSLAAGLALGAGSYGISLVLFIRALAGLGAFRTGILFGTAPLAGAVASIGILGESPSWPLVAGACLMLGGASLLVRERHEHRHRHPAIAHAHPHSHEDLHHDHSHDPPVPAGHTHAHEHPPVEHGHAHRPDIHHRHDH